MPLPKTQLGIIEFKQKISALKKGTRASDETKRKQSESIKKYYEDPIHREERSKRTLKQWENQERRAAMSARMKKRYEDPEERRKTALESTGRKKSKETLAKMQAFQKKRWENPEVRIQASECKMGKKNPMFGKIPSEETKRKISESLKGRVVSEETRKKISEANMGKVAPHAGKTRPAWIGEKISNAKKGIPLTEHHKKQLSEAHMGKVLSETHKKNISRLQRGSKRSYKALLSILDKRRGGLWYGCVKYDDENLYCEKFTTEFKKRVRAYWDYACFECGENRSGKSLPVHHVHYDKKMCCNGSPQDVVPLCPSCHSKTNYNRGYWEDRFTTKLYALDSSGKCFFTKDEMVNHIYGDE